MAYFEEHTATTIQQFIIDFAAFCTSNGWTVDYLGVYEVTGYRLHMHKGAFHIDGSTISGTQSYWYHCTGYLFSSPPSTQPGGVGGAGNVSISAGWKYKFYSTVGAILFYTTSSAITKTWSCIFHIQTKIGAFSDGFGVFWYESNGVFVDYTTTGNIYVNGAWGGSGGTGNALSCIPPYPGLSTCGPNMYNAALVPFPILIGRRYLTDTTKRQPLGYVPGIYACNGTSIYDDEDIVTIGGADYRITRVAGDPSSNNHMGHYLIKLGA